MGGIGCSDCWGPAMQVRLVDRALGGRRGRQRQALAAVKQCGEGG